MPYVKAIQPTKLKTHPIDSNSTNLPPDFAAFNTGPTAKPLAASKVIRDSAQYARLEFTPHLTIGGKKYTHLYVFAPHWEGITALVATQVATASPLSAAGSSIVQRQCTHYTQNNNYDWQDDGSASNLRFSGVQCGLSSLAIALSEPGLLTPEQHKMILAGSPTGKFDDGVAAVFKKIGAQSIAMEGHAAVLKHLGIDSICSRTATIAELKEHIEKYSIAVLGTIYKGSGHFVAAAGFDIKKNLVLIKDPYGIRDKQSTNQWEEKFADESQVKDDWWSADLMAALWSSQKDGWCVLPKPKQTVVLSAPTIAAVGTEPANTTGTPRLFKPQEFRTNSISVKFIGHFEGLELAYYTCSSGVPTIGLGTTRWKDGVSPIPPGAVITEAEAVEFFKRDSKEFMNEIQRLVDVPLSARQIAAILSFCYNCGWSGFEESSLLKSINARASFEEIRTNFRKWNKGPDGPIEGLTRRRNAEAMLWENRDDWDKAGYQ